MKNNQDTNDLFARIKMAQIVKRNRMKFFRLVEAESKPNKVRAFSVKAYKNGNRLPLIGAISRTNQQAHMTAFQFYGGRGASITVEGLVK